MPERIIYNLGGLVTWWQIIKSIPLNSYKQLIKRNTSFPISFTIKQIDSLGFKPWHDTLLAFPVNKSIELGLPKNSIIPDTLKVMIKPTTNDSKILPRDQIFIDLLRTNNWKRPIFFAITVNHGNLPWIWPYTKFEGMAYRIVPSKGSIPFDCPVVSRNMMQIASYEKAADWGVYLDDESRNMLSNYLIVLLMLADAQLKQNDVLGCETTLAFIDKNLPMDRLQPSDEYWEFYKQLKVQCRPQ